MIRKLPPMATGLRMRITERERQQADVFIKDAPHFLRLDRQLARLSRDVTRLRSTDGLVLREEGTAAEAVIYWDGSTGVSARRIQ